MKKFKIQRQFSSCFFASAFIAMALTFFSLCTVAQTFNGEPGIPIQKNFLPIDYKANGQNFSITTDKRGVMYFANFAGVLEYDGTSWRTILTKERTKVNTLVTDKSGRIYVGTRGEIGYLQPDSIGTMTFISLNNYLDSNIAFPDVISSYATDNGVYFITAHNIFLWNGKNLKTWTISNTIYGAFYINKRLYVQSENGLQYFDAGKFININGGDVFSKLITANTMLDIGNGRALIGSGNQGLFLLDRDGVSRFQSDANKYFSENIISSSVSLNDGSYAFGTVKGGVVILSSQGNTQQIFSKKFSGLYDNVVNNLFMDDNHGLWIAMASGISRIEVPSFLTFYNNKKNVYGNVTGITRFQDKLYIATDQGLFFYDKEQLQFEPVAALQVSCLNILVYNNQLLIATPSGVYGYDGHSSKLLMSGYALVLYNSPSNNSVIYVGQLDGLSMLQNVNGQLKYQGKLGNINDEIREIAEDGDQNIWLQAPAKGLLKYNPKTRIVKLYNKNEGLPYNTGNNVNPTSMGILIGTINGVYAYDKTSDSFKKFNLFDADSTINDAWVSKIVEDQNNNLITTAGDGTTVMRFRKEANNKYILDNAVLLSMQDQQIFSIYVDGKGGNVWLGSSNNLVVFNTNTKTDFSIKKPVLIRSVTVNTDSLLFNGTYFDADSLPDFVQNNSLTPSLGYQQNNISFTYSSPLSIEKNDIVFKYFLEGFDNDTSSWVSERRKEYSNLPPGNYVFHVKSKSIFGIESPEATYAFNIRKPLYLMWWAYVFYFLLLAGVVILFVRVRSLKLLKEKKKLEELIEKRTEEVVIQKEEIEKQSLELSNKNDELEKINLIVKSINAEINFNSLMQSILDKTRVIRGAEKAAMLVYDKAANLFSFKASFGYDVKELDTIHLTTDEAEARYLNRAEEMYEDIFSIKAVRNSNKKDTLFAHLNKAKSSAVMVIKVNKQTEAYLILENWQKQNAFTEKDFSLLRNLKEHFIAAFIKTTLLEEVQNALTNLKETQDQLIRHEKLASIGQLTKGIVDRILNPLNYINNFSLLSKDLIDESLEIIEVPESTPVNKEEVAEILTTVKSNLQKVSEHGNSASRIVKGMEKILREKSNDYIDTDINKLVARDAELAIADFKKEYPDAKIVITTHLGIYNNRIKILPFEMSMVLTNLLNNAFFTVSEKAKLFRDVIPEVVISTIFTDNNFEIHIRDNGRGINATEMKQLFSPFFTTKPTAKGTGLGLYLSQDIVKEHKGSISVNTKEGEYTEFIIIIPK
jgi:signal transduction histidine kinase/ligand-binding sensor domain-containing protein